MKEDKRVEKELWNHGIRKYKIIRVISKSLSHLYKYGEIQDEEVYEDKMEVRFQCGNKVGGFSISSYQPDYIIVNIIRESIQNAHNTKEKWAEEEFSKYNSDKFRKNMFDTYNKDNYIDWLEIEIAKISCAIGNKIALFYKINLSKYSLRTNKIFLEEYLTNAQITCIVNKCKIEVRDRWLLDSFADLVIRQLKIPQLVYKECDSNKNLIIKGSAVAQIINKYILMYYSSYVYEGDSFIKTVDLGKKLLEKDIDIMLLPYKNIYFDGEGYRIKRKGIIQSGVLKDLLSNSFYSLYLGVESYGNSDMDNPNLIKHQRIIFRVNTTSRNIGEKKAILHEFQQINLNFKKLELTGIAVIEDDNYKYLSAVNFKLNEFLSKVFNIGATYSWYDNVLCSDVFFDFS